MHHGVDPSALIIIVTAYMIFAFLVFLSALRVGWRTKEGETRIILSIVFMLCGATGYGAHFLPPEYDWLSRLGHWVLAFAAIMLCVRTFMGDMFN